MFGFIVYFEGRLCFLNLVLYFCREAEWNAAFNYSSDLSFLTACLAKTGGNFLFSSLFGSQEKKEVDQGNKIVLIMLISVFCQMKILIGQRL